MNTHAFPVIDLIATGDNIRRLRLERGFTVRDLQTFFGFEQPQAIYKWQKGACLPTVDNLYALGSLFGVPMDQILIPVAVNLPSYIEQQESSCCSSFFMGIRQRGKRRAPFAAAGCRSGWLQNRFLKKHKNSNTTNGDVCACLGKGRPRNGRFGGLTSGRGLRRSGFLHSY